MVYLIGTVVAVYSIGLLVTFDEGTHKFNFKWPVDLFKSFKR